MVQGLEALSEQEMELVLKAPVLVGILVAGADGNIDKKEIKEAISVISLKKKSGYTLSSYLQQVSQDFEDKLMVLLQNYPNDPAQRAIAISHELSELNDIWSKTDRHVAKELYFILLELAHRIASSSGGVFGYKKVDQAEEPFINLPMIKDPAD